MRGGLLREGSQESPGEVGARVRRGAAVRGVVQGVGFRPFVFRLAHEEELAGFIGNDTDGVTIEVEGAAVRVEAFLARLQAEAPPLARIDSVRVAELEAKGDSGFRIVASEVLGRVHTGIPADAATCVDCQSELLDPEDRRYRYPFLNCTNCGPRYTITRKIPYDRPQTSMARFTMCKKCQAEYDDPGNRRFHAQPNACWECGPWLWLSGPGGTEIAGDEAMESCVNRLAGGAILAIKGIGGFHLAVDATNDVAVMRLRERKQRYGKPFAVMVKDLAAAREICELTAEEEALLLTSARPIVLARKKEGSGIATGVAPGIPWLGVFLPYAPLQHLLFADGRLRALVMTSANLSEEPIAIDNEEARRRLGGIADALVLHDREILQRCDDSVMAVVDGAPQLIRRARGFVPQSVALPEGMDAPHMLAVGGHLKNVLALAEGRKVVQSQHLGDLENMQGLAFFEETLAHLMKTFEIDPEVVVHDLHPGYLSTEWAKKWAGERGLPLVGVQHHHAHVAGCMAEHRLTGEAIGLALDGTGYGSDGKIWGGEVLIAGLEGPDPGKFDRFAHLEYVPMAGGDAAVKEPWRMALGALVTAGFGADSAEVAALIAGKEREAKVLLRMMERELNAPMTSSLGRLFDAVAAVVLGRRTVDYEAQAAIELEGISLFAEERSGYPIELEGGDWARREPMLLTTRGMWSELLKDLWAGVGKAQIGARFHAGVAEGFVKAAVAARKATGIRQVAMSGGCLHNRRLAQLLREKLEAEGFSVYLPRKVSPGDGGLSYGQVAVGAARMAERKGNFDVKP
jgi:hydrogenase maturation protein HypF